MTRFHFHRQCSQLNERLEVGLVPLLLNETRGTIFLKRLAVSSGKLEVSLNTVQYVTLDRILMLKVKARARHAFTLKQKNLF